MDTFNAAGATAAAATAGRQTAARTDHPVPAGASPSTTAAAPTAAALAKSFSGTQSGVTLPANVADTGLAGLHLPSSGHHIPSSSSQDSPSVPSSPLVPAGQPRSVPCATFVNQHFDPHEATPRNHSPDAAVPPAVVARGVRPATRLGRTPSPSTLRLRSVLAPSNVGEKNMSMSSALESGAHPLDAKPPPAKVAGYETASFSDAVVKIFVRTPQWEAADFCALVAPRTCSVSELKTYLSFEHPLRPKVEDQRLIFAGKVLEDNDYVQDLIKKCDPTHPQTFHLVVRHRAMDTCPKSSAPSATEAAGLMQPTNAVSSSGERVQASRPPSSAGHHSADQAQNFPVVRSSPHLPAERQQAPQQPEYLRSLSGAAGEHVTAGEAEPIQLPAQIVLLNGMPYQPVHINGLPYLMSLPLPQPEHYAAPQLFNVHVRHVHESFAQLDDEEAVRIMNAQQQRQQEQEQQNRQNLQNNVSAVQLALKIAFFLFIFCRNASIERIILIHLFGVVIFLHQTGRLRIVRERVRRNGDVAVDAGQRQQPAAGAQARFRGGLAEGGALEAVARAAWRFLTSMIPVEAAGAPPEA